MGFAYGNSAAFAGNCEQARRLACEKNDCSNIGILKGGPDSLSIKSWNPLLGLLILIIVASSDAFGATYKSGHHALELWDNNAIGNTPLPVRAWLMFMLASFAAGLPFTWRHSIARWVVGGSVLSVCGIFVLSTLGFTVLSGLVALTHLIFWSPGLFLLLKHRPFLAKPSPFSVWAGLITLVVLISFAFDIRDATIYLDHVLSTGLLL